ncbi:hypothetical protein C7460_10491 [Marinoscillum furvescens DSM 4134]|uniref:Uncharacterized protein n=2 Tax=Marinoscillum furvescens TaxID=1026 RepID=A0A3D9L507_MARFU|nr:hypothetical protein C7460_10491 [Marinoscillum furvescens DSM 4134]
MANDSYKLREIMKALIERTILVVVVLLVALPVMAQGAPPATPIDGGLSLLLAAGGVYGIKKIRDSL